MIAARPHLWEFLGISASSQCGVGAFAVTLSPPILLGLGLVIPSSGPLSLYSNHVFQASWHVRIESLQAV